MQGVRVGTLMLSDFPPIHSSRLWRAAYVVCILLVLSYILFDVLDLDGSDFSRLLTPVERVLIAAVLPCEAQLDDSSEPAPPWSNVPLLFIDTSEKYNWRRKVLRFSSLDSARSHGYRGGLPRASLPDSSPY